MGHCAIVGAFPLCTKPKPSIIGLRQLCAASLLMFLVCSLGFSRTRETGAASFSIDLDKPFDEVVVIVDEVARRGSIKGTFEYRGDEQLSGAQFQEKSQLFPAWSEPGKVFYKIRTKALSPSHFVNSNDVGTVAVRYVVQDRGPNSTRLFIDAVFVENARHHSHPSDGYVETCEFGEIGKLLKERERFEAEAAAGEQFSPARQSTSRPAIAGVEVAHQAQKPMENEHATRADSAKVADLERATAEQKSLLAAERSDLDKLETRARQLRAAEFVRIKSDRAELKALPYSHARVVEALKKGQEVTILAKSAYWYQVRCEDGQEGWISHAHLEVQP